jgi:hypothetical protein
LSPGAADHPGSDTPPDYEVTRSVIGADELTDAGGVGTPELTPPRLHLESDA